MIYKDKKIILFGLLIILVSVFVYNTYSFINDRIEILELRTAELERLIYGI